MTDEPDPDAIDEEMLDHFIIGMQAGEILLKAAISDPEKAVEIIHRLDWDCASMALAYVVNLARVLVEQMSEELGLTAEEFVGPFLASIQYPRPVWGWDK